MHKHTRIHPFMPRTQTSLGELNTNLEAYSCEFLALIL